MGRSRGRGSLRAVVGRVRGMGKGEGWRRGGMDRRGSTRGRRGIDDGDRAKSKQEGRVDSSSQREKREFVEALARPRERVTFWRAGV